MIATSRQGQPNPTVVDKLEKWLAQAKRGEINAIAAAIARPNGSVSLDYYLGPTGAALRVAAASSMLHIDIAREILSGCSEGSSDG